MHDAERHVVHFEGELILLFDLWFHDRLVFVDEFRRRIPGYMLRHKVKAGITGWAQINGWRGNTSIEERIKCDLYYIENWSMSLDLKILLQTLWLGFRNRNAY